MGMEQAAAAAFVPADIHDAGLTLAGLIDVLDRADDALGPGLYAEEEIAPRSASAAQRAVGDAVLAATADRTGGAPLYARVDLVPAADGEPVLIELELTEPSLFLTTDDTAAARVAAASAARAR